MDMKKHLIDMANYHKWACQRLCDSLDNISDNDYYKDSGLFFKSIHQSLNHLYVVDVLWLSRFKQTANQITALDQELCCNRAELKHCLMKQADLWIDFVNKIDHYPEVISYDQMDGRTTKRPYLSAIAHVFNHGTHHRGQITAVISQLGVQTPELDFSYYLADLI